MQLWKKVVIAVLAILAVEVFYFSDRRHEPPMKTSVPEIGVDLSDRQNADPLELVVSEIGVKASSSELSPAGQLVLPRAIDVEVYLCEEAQSYTDLRLEMTYTDGEEDLLQELALEPIPYQFFERSLKVGGENTYTFTLTGKNRRGEKVKLCSSRRAYKIAPFSLKIKVRPPFHFP